MVFDSLQEGARCYLPHPLQRLAYGGETRVVVYGNSYVIEPHHRDVPGNSQSRLLEGKNCTYCGKIVIREQCGEWPSSRKQLCGEWIAQLGCGISAFELNDKLRPHGNAEFLGNFADGLPAILGIWTFGRSLHKSDFSVTQFGQMLQGQPYGLAMIQHNIRNPFPPAMPGNRNCWQWQGPIDQSVHGNQSFHTAIQQKVRIGFQQPGIIADSNCKKEVVLLPKVSFNAADDGGAVEVPDLLSDHANRIGAFHTQIASIEAGPVIQLTGGLENSLVRLWWHRLGRRGFVQHRRTGSLREPHALGYHLARHRR